MDISLILLLGGSLAIPIISKQLFNTSITIQEMLIHCVLVTIVVTSVWNIGKWSKTDDTETLNGYIISKHRDHDTYEDPYDCFCTTDSKGNSSCSTCYETRYTVEWYAKSTVGQQNFKSLDESSRSVYLTPDPAVYANCQAGQPAAANNSYTNYVQAVPQSLFAETASAEDFPGKVPAYPHVFNYYQVDHVLNVDSNVPQSIVTLLDSQIDHMLKDVGAAKQANVIVVLTEIDDPTYRYAVEQTWLGGKKNDIIIFVGLDDMKITWVDIMTWALNSGNELFHVTMRDGISNMNTLDINKLTPFIRSTILELYDRPEMKDYKHLESEIVPPTWVIWLAFFFGYGGGIALVWYFHNNDVDLFRSRRRY